MGVSLGLWLLVPAVVFIVIAFLKDLTEADKNNDNDFDIVPFLKKRWYLVVLLLIAVFSMSSIHTVPPGYRGVLLTFGSVSDRIMPEGLNFKMPWQNVVNMKVSLEIAEVMESTASNDLQEVSTQLAVHYNIIPDMVDEVYKNMRDKYHGLLLIPVIQEDLKAITAQFSAEELITNRPMVVLRLEDKLQLSLNPYGINVQTINIVDFQFSESFSLAIDEKVTAEQKALTAKNYLEQVRWEQEQEIVKQEAAARVKIINAEAQRNATITQSLGDAEAVTIAADAEYYKIIMEQQGTAEGIAVVTASLTPEYVRYLYMLEWDGNLPDVVAGVEGTDILLLFEEGTPGG